MRDGIPQSRELFASVPADVREDEALNNENELLEKAEAEADRQNSG